MEKSLALAAQQAGLTTIDCRFYDGELTAGEVLEQQLVENLLREDLQPIEEAKAYRQLMRLNSWNGKQVAAALHVPPARVSRALALLRLPGDVQEQVQAGAISARAAYQISRLDDGDVQRQLADQAAAGALTHDQAARAARQRQGKPRKRPRGVKQTFLHEDGWKVVVSASQPGTYHDVERALEIALAEVRLRIDSGMTLF